ncbi:MAG: FkbM family methyltransferase, partial [Ferruginibacter sp.]
FPDTFKKFRKNLDQNPDISNKIQIENIGLGAVPGVLNMYQDCETNSGANRMVPVGKNNETVEVTVLVTTMDNFIKEKNIKKIDLIKIDVEGFEMMVLQGAKETLRNFKPALFIELDDANLKKQGDSAEGLCNFLIEYGYKIYEESNTKPFDFYNLSKQVNIYCTANS